MADTKTRPTRPAEPAVIYDQLVAELGDPFKASGKPKPELSERGKVAIQRDLDAENASAAAAAEEHLSASDGE